MQECLPTQIPSEELERRRAALVQRLQLAELDMAVLWTPATVCYLTGNEIAGASAVILRSDADMLVICDEYDAYNFTAASSDIRVSPYRYDTTWPSAVQHLVGTSRKRVGLETAGMPFQAYLALCSAFGPDGVVPIDDAVADVRLVKSAFEIACIRQAAHAVEAAIGEAAAALGEELTESELASRIYAGLLRAGSEFVASQPYVKSGERALLTHARWSQRHIRSGEHVLLEVGGAAHRYHAAIMRTRQAADRSSAYQRAVEAVVAGRDTYLRVARPGISASALHTAYLEALDAYGLRHWNRHPSGYSLGIAFPPLWGETALLTVTHGANTILQAGMVLHLISGISDPESGIPHIGLSECVLVTEHGCERLVEVSDFL